jgi:hypothetical protein
MIRSDIESPDWRIIEEVEWEYMQRIEELEHLLEQWREVVWVEPKECMETFFRWKFFFFLLNCFAYVSSIK